MYQIELLNGAQEDLDALPAEIFDEAMVYFERYKADPFSCSQPLKNQGGRNLSGCRKTYLASAAYRIVIKVEKDIAKIVSVVCVGERKDMTVYEAAAKRLISNENREKNGNANDVSIAKKCV